MCRLGGLPSLFPYNMLSLISVLTLPCVRPPMQHAGIPVHQPSPLESRQTDSQKLPANLSECKQTEDLMNLVLLSDVTSSEL